MAKTLAEGLAQLLGTLPAEITNLDTFSNVDPDTVTSGQTADSDIDLSSLEAVNARSRQLAETASGHYEAAQAALQDGDWATYGEELDQLEEVLNELMETLATP
jgi:uncharacterized membrane protein (UPF0182 family)